MKGLSTHGMVDVLATSILFVVLFHLPATICASNIRSGRTSYASISSEGLSPSMIIPETIDNKRNSVYTVTNPRVLQAEADFAPLSCNVDLSTCQPWPFGNTIASSVTVPCNTCYTMSQYTSGNDVVEIDGLLDIQGRLDFPNGSKLELKTKGIVVQGELTMASNKVIDGSPDITIVIMSDDNADVSFVPHSQNADACGGVGVACSLGPKPMVVMGGKVTIEGMPNESCKTWTTVSDLITGTMPEPVDYPTMPILPSPSDPAHSCDTTFILEDFEDGSVNGWYGNLGSEESVEDHANDVNDDSSIIGGAKYLKIARRTHEYQGPMIDLPLHKRECLMGDVDYLFSVKIRIQPGEDYPIGANSDCHTSQTNCPKLQFSNMDASGAVRWRELVSTDDNVGGLNIQDGKWFHLRAAIRLESYTFVDPTNIFSLFAINGVEPGVDISIDDVKLILPSEDMFPADKSTVCSNLVVNGDAESSSEFTYPLRSYMRNNILQVASELNNDGTTNQYFTMSGRTKAYDSIAIDIPPDCLQSFSVYSFSADIRVHSDVQAFPKIRLAARMPGEATPRFDVIQNACPSTSNDIGWITCAADFTVPLHLSKADSVQVFIIFPSSSAGGVNYPANLSDDADFDNIKFEFKSPPHSGIELDNMDGLDQCWAPGAEIVVPSDTLMYNDVQIKTLSDVRSTGVVNIEGDDLVKVTTTAESMDYAAEMALLSRNILFQNGGTNFDVGPSFVVLRTPGVRQVIEGVEFRGFGQESVWGQNPINFKLNKDSASSLISKNTIRFSKNRCVNIDQTNNVKVDSNVAYSTLGHCYALQNGDETSNTFSNNLGTLTRKASAPPGGSDYECATFYITNPSNSFTNNRAAGSEFNGFWFEMSPPANSLDFTSFSDNTAHSNGKFGIKTFPTGLSPQTENVWTNTKAYRNQRHGLIMHNSRNIHVDGGAFADNWLSIDVWSSDAISVSNAKIEGYSSSFKSKAEAVPGTLKHCYNAEGIPIVGIRLHPNAMVDDYGGTKITNIEFSGYTSANGCNPSSSAFAMNAANIKTFKYTTTTEVSGLKFAELSSEPRDEISLCANQDKVMDIVINDIDGSLNPSASGPGFVVSNSPLMTQSGTCVNILGGCAKYCTGVDIDQLGKTDPPSRAPTLPGNPTASPKTASPVIENSPQSICLSNGDFELDDENWSYTLATPSIVTGFGGSGKALRASKRGHQARGGPWQKISTSCFQAEEWYEIRADVKLNNLDSLLIFDCDPSVLFLSSKTCSGISLIIGNTVKDIAYQVGPYNKEGLGWNEIYGVFKATSDIISAENVNLVVARAPVNADITIDNVRLNVADDSSIGVTNCANPIFNGDAETGDHRSWFLRGITGRGQLDIISPGYQSDYAFRHTGTRSDRYMSMIQIVDNSCFVEGSKWTIFAKFRAMNSNGEFIVCDKEQKNTSNSCPTFAFRAGNAVDTGVLGNWDNADGPVVAGEWNTIKTGFVVTAAMASYPDMWINVISPVGMAYDLDNIAMWQRE